MTSFSERSKAAVCLILGSFALSACVSEAEETSPASPLQPLVYTEVPNLTPAAARVRERRLMRQLVERAPRADASAAPNKPLPAARDAQTLGRLIFDAVLKQDDALWNHVFVSPKSYSRMVHVKPKVARKVIDEMMGDSQPTWDLFAVKHLSEMPEGGLQNVFEFKGLTLGQGRMSSGQRAREGERAQQYWGNVLKLGLRGSDVVFELRISKILSVVDRAKEQSGRPILAIASKVTAAQSLRVFVAAGLHLKAQLMRAQDYPYPLAVGNFWRYKRYDKGQDIKSTGMMDSALNAPIEQLLPAGQEQLAFDASETLVEVLSVKRFGSMRLIKMRKSYNDQKLTSRDYYWLMTPRRIYACSRACVRKVDDLSWMLGYMQRQSPLLEFPMRPGHQWGKKQKMVVGEQTRTIETPAGTFLSTYQISGLHLDKDPQLTAKEVTQSMAVGKGIVEISRAGVTWSGESKEIIESLIEQRIMP